MMGALEPARPDANELIEMLEAADLPPPTLDLPHQWTRLGEYALATWPCKAQPYLVDDLLREATEELHHDATLVAIDGHGVASWALHLLMRRNSLIYLAQAGIGGPYRDAGENWSAVMRLWENAEDVAAIADIVPEGYGMLIMSEGDLTMPRWAFVDPGAEWDSVRWRPGGVDLERVGSILESRIAATITRG